MDTRTLFLTLISVLLLTGQSCATFHYVTTINATGVNGSRADELFGEPVSVALGRSVYVADAEDALVYSMEDNIKDRDFGENLLTDVSNLYVDDTGYLYICSPRDKNIYVFKHSSNLDTFAEKLHFYKSPTAISYYNGSYYVLDEEGRVYVHDNDEKYLGSILKHGECMDCLYRPYDMMIYNGELFVTEPRKDVVKVFWLNGTLKRTIGGTVLDEPHGLYVSFDRVFVADTENSQVVVFTTNGREIDRLNVLQANESNITLSEPYDVWVNGSLVYVVDKELQSVFVLNYTDVLMEDAEELIASGNESVKRLETLIEKSKYLNVSWASNVSIEYAIAVDGIRNNNIEYLKMLNRTIDKAEAEYATLCGLIINASKDYIEEVEAVMKEYRGYIDTSEIDDKLLDLNIYIEEWRCNEAADTVNEIDNMIKTINETNASYKPGLGDEQTQEINRTLEVLRSRVEGIERLNEQYKQSLNITQLNTGLMIIESYVEVGDTDSAVEEMRNLEQVITQWEDYLKDKGEKIDNALAVIEETESKLKSTGMNTTENIERISFARSIVYDAPESAVQICNSILEQDESNDALMIISGSVIILVIMIAVGYLHRKLKNAF